MSDSDDLWMQVITIYRHAKDGILSAEELAEDEDDDDNKYLQPTLEFASALDHIANAKAALIGLDTTTGNGEPQATERRELVIAIHHLHSAFFDTADWLNMRVRGRILAELHPYPPECIQAVIPTYYSEIRPKLDKIGQGIAAIRGKRNLPGGGQSGSELFPEVVNYKQLLNTMLSYYQQIRTSKGSLIEWYTKYRKAIWYTRIWDVAIGVCAGLVAAGVVLAWDQIVQTVKEILAARF